jgi:pimeloyl-ACP methyl ester carboxylesterase
MRETNVAGVPVWLDPAEAGGRYRAPILILPGLFQSSSCWRGVTSMLAHRGWNVYVLPRAAADTGAGGSQGGWEAVLATAVRVAANLDEKIVLFGADVGAGLALATLEHVRPLALALFAPVEPTHAGRAYGKSLGFFRRGAERDSASVVSAPASIAKTAARASDREAEPRGLIENLSQGIGRVRREQHPPALVFVADGDPLVDSNHAAEFAATNYAKLARTRLAGRWWPSTRWEPIVDEVHRFLILTLADRVVEFPDEILDD